MSRWQLTLLYGALTMFMLLALNCLDIVIPSYTDLTLLNFAGLSLVGVEFSLIPFVIPPLWRKFKCLRSSFEIKVTRAKHPRWQTLLFPAAAGTLLGAAIVLWFISLTASAAASNYNAFLIFTCPQPVLVLGLSGASVFAFSPCFDFAYFDPCGSVLEARETLHDCDHLRLRA